MDAEMIALAKAFASRSASSGPAGADGKNGVTFTPAVSSAGVLSWSNDGGLENPASVDIRGPAGPTGAQGPKGDTGPQGETGPTGSDGQSAYAAAQAGGYTDTEGNFYADLAAMQGLAASLAAI